MLDWYALHKLESGDMEFVKLQEQVFLIKMLQDALCSGLRKIHRPGVWHGIMSSWLEHQCSRANWCPHTVRNLKLNFDDGAQAYTFGLSTARTDRSHAERSAVRCVANQLGEYGTTKHRQQGRTCEQISIGISKIVEILKNEKIPVFTIERQPDNSETLRLNVRLIEAGTPYLAVSHAWADGLANPLANQLPSRQLKYLRHVIDLILQYKPHPNVQHYELEGLNNVAIWFDGLCIPVEPEHQELRDFSISKRRTIYDESTGVIVLDPDMQRLGPGTTNNELLMRLLLSGWSSRLRRFQEGALAFDISLVGNECVFNLLDIRRDAKISTYHDHQLSFTLSQALSSRLFRAIIFLPLTSSPQARQHVMSVRL